MMPEQITTIKSPSMLQEGDYMLIGNAKWIFDPRFAGSLTYRFCADEHALKEVGDFRDYSISEIGAFAEAGFLYRMVPSRIKFADDEKVTR